MFRNPVEIGTMREKLTAIQLAVLTLVGAATFAVMVWAMGIDMAFEMLGFLTMASGAVAVLGVKPVPLYRVHRHKPHH
ncbi:MAG: hypothetical protein H6865_07235 [Rhodospirillales bacterium]|nr:hypothetical protein [Alphaproteobacteria bacterium]MCB9987410.1 hypothetical protein [Rhodospirillales bacterium]USO07608.1 MAG: hypothetical protein H6866_09420 [Rhodospirillales bacterium]